MKEYPESNYFLSVSAIGDSIDPQLGTLLPRTYLIQVNLITRIVIVSWLPASPWPPRYPTDWDYWRDRDEAACYLFATNVVTVAPTEEREARIQTVIFDEYPETAHTVFWYPPADYEALLADVERAYDTPDPSELRLDELAPGPLIEFLRHELPRASLDPYERKILCLDPPSVPSPEDDRVSEEIPPALLSKHPELVSIGQALEQLRLGQPVTATCIHCGQRLTAESVEATGALVICCPAGHTFFRAKRK